jgi:hypothetical protein
VNRYPDEEELDLLPGSQDLTSASSLLFPLIYAVLEIPIPAAES